MKTVIIGAGAMGSLFGALLSEAGEDVCLLDIWKDHVDAMNANGLMVESQGQTRCVRVTATFDPGQVDPADLVVIFVKSTSTSKAAKTAAGLLRPDGLVMTLQNGLGNADAIAQVIDAPKVVAGTTSHGATVLGPGRIRHAGSGPTLIGMWANDDLEPVRRIAAFFTAAGIESEAADDIHSVVWNKLLVNVGINAITALTGIKNGQLLTLATTRALARAAVQEAMVVAQAMGVDIRADAADYVLEIARATGLNRSSMGQDVDRKRLTEIGVINGVIVEKARKAGLDAPINQTLTTLIETLQAHYE
jgi:2-dehydropantoate 2-reductase